MAHELSGVLRRNPRAERASDLKPVHIIAADELDRLKELNAELLEALEKCADWLSTEFEDAEDSFHSNNVLKPARAAIAKATGEDQ